MFQNVCPLRIARTPLPRAAMMAAVLALVLAVPVEAVDKLPSGVTYRLKKIDQALQNLQKHKGITRGDRDVREAKRRMGEIVKGYAKYKGHPDVAARQKQIDAAVAAHEAAKDKAAADRPRVAALKDAAGGLDALDHYMTRASLAAPEQRIKEAKAHLDSAKGAMDQLLADHPEQKAHADVVAMRKRIETAEAKFKAFREKILTAAAADRRAADRHKSANDAWIAKIKPYLLGDKRILSRPCTKAEDAKKQLLYVQEATELLKAYKQAKFPQGRTKQLESWAADLAERVKKAPEMFKKSADNVAGQAGRRVGRALKFLADASWKKDPGKKPVAYTNKMIQEIAATVDAFALIAPEGDKRLAALRKGLQLLKQYNQERRDASLDRNLMKADKYKGKDASGVKAAAKQALLAKHKDAKMLRQTVITPKWTELTEVVRVRDPAEGRDVLRAKVTRHLTSQIAARRGKDVYLYTLDVSQEMKQDGSWSKLRSHIMFTDRMLEKNVGRDAPE